MATDEDKVILKKNGQVVMQALRTLAKPPTLLNLAKHIAETHGTDEDKVRAPLKTFLDSAIDLGIITRTSSKYYLYGDVAVHASEQSDKEVGERGTPHHTIGEGSDQQT